MSESERQESIQRMRKEGRIMEAVQDAAYLCGVERHKIQIDAVRDLRELINTIVDKYDVQLKELPDANQKEVKSITQTDLDDLVEVAMGHLQEAFETLEINGFEQTKEHVMLERLVQQFIDYEKKHRDEELRMDREQR